MVLVHGLGGTGKSRLLQRFQETAAGRLPGSPVRSGRVRTVWLDWEDEQRDRPDLYAAAEGPSLLTVLNALRRAVRDACGTGGKAASRAEQAFAAYREGATRMPQYQASFADVIAQSRQAGSQVTGQDAAVLLRSLASAGLLAAGHPAGIAGLTPGQLAATAQAAGNLSDGAVRAVTGRRRGDIPAADYDLITDPARELPRRIAAALNAIAAAAPVVIFLDTGEVIGPDAWGWLRRVMRQTGPRVIWVAGARFATESEAGPDSPVAEFIRDIGHAQLVLMSPARFDDDMMREYLAARLPARTLTDAETGQVAAFTRGMPLAVSLTAALLEDGAAVQDVCTGAGDALPGTVISQLARRYLIHAEQHPYPDGDPRRGDLARILGLALAYTDLRTDPELLAALWDVSDPLPAFAGLARRHDFVLPMSRRLHDEVRDTLRGDLLDPWRRPGVRDANQRALALYQDRLAGLSARSPGLDQQLGNPGYTTALLAALWHTLWISSQDGLDLLAAILPVLAAAAAGTADAAAAITDHFAATFTDDQRRRLDQLTAPVPPALERLLRSTGRAAFPRRTRISMNALAAPSAAPPEPGYRLGAPGDRDAAIMVLRARLLADGHADSAAVEALRSAAESATSTLLRQAAGTQASAIARRLIWSGPNRTSVPTDIGLEAAHIAAAVQPDSPSAWHNYAAALDDAERLAEALAAYDRAIELDPGSAAAHTGRGIALRHLGRAEEALAAYDRAIELDPGNATTHGNRGVALQHLGRAEEALAACDRAIELDLNDAAAHVNAGITLASLGRTEKALARLDAAERLAPDAAGEGTAWAGAILWHQRDGEVARARFARVPGRVTGCTPFRTAEMEAIALCALGQPAEAEQLLRDALARRVPGDRTDPHEIYDLLADPPLPGISRLRTVAET